MAVFERRGVFDGGLAEPHGLTDRDGKSSETARPTAFAHTLGHVVLVHLHRPPHTRARRRAPQLACLFDHQCALGTVNLQTVFVLARLDDGKRRSEEHTSELQSQSNLVCRLLLEKKKKNTK